MRGGVGHDPVYGMRRLRRLTVLAASRLHTIHILTINTERPPGRRDSCVAPARQLHRGNATVSSGLTIDFLQDFLP